MTSRTISLATDIRPPRLVGADPLARLAAETGAQGIHLLGGCDLREVAPLLVTARHAGVEVASVGLPLPERPLGAGRRLPRLGALESDERAAAIALAERGLTAVVGGVRVIVLDFGPVTLAARVRELREAFARRALDEDPGAGVLAAALDERRARGGAMVDACRWAIEGLLGVAEPLGITLVLPVGATPWEVPSPREAGELVGLFAGARVGLAWDPGRLSVLCTLGLPLSDGRLKTLAETAALAIENDAVGLQAGLLPGLGERAPRVASLVAPSSAPVVVLGAADVTDEEVAGAVARTLSGAGS